MQAKFKLLILLCVIVGTNLYAQPDGKYHPAMKKIEELEKIKLLEALNMDEETTLRFFSRRSEHQGKIHKLKEEREELIKLMSDKIKSKNESEIKKLIDDYIQIEKQIDAEKLSFLNSVTDLLSIEQHAKLIVFEREFREEIKSILMRDRKHKNR